ACLADDPRQSNADAEGGGDDVACVAELVESLEEFVDAQVEEQEHQSFMTLNQLTFPTVGTNQWLQSYLYLTLHARPLVDIYCQFCECVCKHLEGKLTASIHLLCMRPVVSHLALFLRLTRFARLSRSQR